MGSNLEVALALWGFGAYCSLRYDRLMEGGFDLWGLWEALKLAPWWPLRLLRGLGMIAGGIFCVIFWGG